MTADKREWRVGVIGPGDVRWITATRWAETGEEALRLCLRPANGGQGLGPVHKHELRGGGYRYEAYDYHRQAMLVALEVR